MATMGKLGRLKPETTARLLGFLLLIAIIASLCWSFAIDDVDSVPDYALDSTLIFHLERTVVALGLLTIPLIVLAQLLAGRLPSSVGKDGVNWAPYVEAEQERIDQLKEAVDQLSLVAEGLTLSDAERARQIATLEQTLASKNS